MTTESRRLGVLGVHSLDHFAITVPDLRVARGFYASFGLDVRETDTGFDLYTYGHSHRWAHLTGGDRKALRYISFGAYPDDMERFARHIDQLGIPRSTGRNPHAESFWMFDPNNIAVEIRSAEKSSPNVKPPAEAPHASLRGAPMRDEAALVRPRRMSHAAFFAADLDATLDFYIRVLGLRLSDRSGPAAFLHGVHGSDHHLIALVGSPHPGYHHSAWDVRSIDEVGLGAAQMARAGHAAGWGLGRHVLGSNYFHYVRDPWGSYAEYSFDMDYVPADLEWPSVDASPENGLYLWGPAPPPDFGCNTETGPI